MGLPTLRSINFKEPARIFSDLGRWEFMFVVAPLVVIGATGSVVNPIAVF